MADNTELNTGSGGDTIASDDIGGVKYQRVKAGWGADGAYSETAVASPSPVQISDGTDTALVSAGGALLVDASATTQPISHAALTELAAAITGNVLAVDGSGVTQPISGTVTIQDGGNTITVDGTVAVTHAALTELAAAIDTELQVDVVSSGLPTGASTLAEQQSQTTLLGTIDGDTGSILTAVQILDNVPLVDDAAFTPASSSVAPAGFFADEASTDSVDEGDIGAARMTLDRQVRVVPGVATSGGASIFRSIDLDETEEEVKATPGLLYGWFITNLSSSTRYIKFYNLTAANTSVGSSTPILTIPLEADQASNIWFASGLTFDTALSVAATTGLADADTGAPGANDCVVNVFYK